MQRLKYRNPRGSEVAFDMAAPYIFWKIEGLDIPTVEPVYTQAPGQDGYTLHSLLIEERTVKLTGHVHGVAGVEAMYEARKRLNAVLNPAFGVGTLIYENDHGSWEIPAFCSENPYLDKLKNIQTLSMSFRCPSPYWLSALPGEIKLAYVEGGLEFPVVTPNKFGILGYKADIDNDSDGVLPLEIYLGGGSVNPMITNTTTGEFIRIEQHFAEADRLYINTDPQKLEVSLLYTDPETNQEARRNAYGYLTRDSSLITLAPGRNVLVFESDDENRKVRVILTFRKRYVGV